MHLDRQVGHRGVQRRAVLFGLALWALALPSQGSGASGGDPPAGEQAGLSVADALAPRVRTLSRPVYSYHYALRTRLGLPADGYVAPDDPRALEYVDLKWRRYWDLSIPTAPYATASGLYVGVDPVIPRAFGGVGDVWSMVQIVLPGGFRFVDVRRDPRAPRADDALHPEVRERLSEAGCEVKYPETLLVSMEVEACRRAAVATLRELGVDGILYQFQRFKFERCGGSDRPAGGFIVIRPEVLEPSRIKLFTKESRPDDAAARDRLVIRELFRRARAAGSHRKVPWPNLESAVPPQQVDSWMERHLFGCGDSAEDRRPPAAAAASG